MKVIVLPGGCERCAQSSAEKAKAEVIFTENPEDIKKIKNEMCLVFGSDGVYLTDGENTVCGNFDRMIPRLKTSNLREELVVKAAKIKGLDKITVLDATAGMGEDSLLLAAYGFDVLLYEYDSVIATLLVGAVKKALKNAEKNDILYSAACRMTVFESDSIEAMKQKIHSPDVVLLDPMFPERQKSALVKKKFQLLQKLERPCLCENELLASAKESGCRKIVIKRPLKGEYLANVKPDYSLFGKAIRYDCINIIK